VSDSVHPATLDALARLREIVDQKLDPADAERIIQGVIDAHPGVDIDLIWQTESYDGSTHYDCIIRFDGGATLSLAYCADSTLPWPLRGAQRWNDRDLVRINGHTIGVENAMVFLEGLWHQPVLRNLVDSCLIRQALMKEPISLDDQEMQRALDDFRRGHGLLTPEATLAWMVQRGISQDQLEQLVMDSATMARLKQRVAAGRVERYFEEHPGEFDLIRFAIIEHDDAPYIEELHRRLLDGGKFYEVAQEHYFGNGGSNSSASFFSCRCRDELPVGLANTLFAAEPGEIVGPVSTAGGTAIFHVLGRTTGQLDDAVRARIEKLLFEPWLTELRSAARIEWNWGHARKTG
jgi:putative peptide maturation system protein